MGSRGVALPLALLLCLALGFVMVAAANFSLTAGRIALHFDASHRALNVAEAGLDRSVELLATALEAGASLPDTLAVVVADSLNGFTYEVKAEVRREPGGRDLNANGIPNEVVRYDRAWGYRRARAAGGSADPGPPVRLLTSVARRGYAYEQLELEVTFERDPAVPSASARGAWAVVPLRWSSFAGEG